MLCRACGLDTKRTDYCEWCKKPLAGGQPVAPTAAVPNVPTIPQQVTRTRTTLTGEVIEEVVPLPPAHPENVPPPQLGAVQLPIAATAELLTDSRLYEDDTPLSTRWEKFLAMYLPVFAVSFLLSHYAPHLFVWITILDVFLAGLLLSASRAIPSFDDAYGDVGVALVVAFLLGPIIALIGLIVVGLVKQEMNGSVIALLATFLIVRYLSAFAFQSVTDVGVTLSVLVTFGITNTLALFLTFAGWICGSFFRPMDEV